MLVAGVDSSTQSTKVVLCDAGDGTVVGRGSAPHPPGTEVDPAAWWGALGQAGAGLLDQAAAVGVAGQQHGMVVLDEAGQVIRPALLWNDLRSAAAAAELIGELGGRDGWAKATGSVPTASFTVTKLRWLATAEPGAAARVRTVLLPHDWLTWRLAGAVPGAATTDRGDASGTGYFSPASGEWLPGHLSAALGHPAELPRVARPGEAVGEGPGGAVLSAGTGDNRLTRPGHPRQLRRVAERGRCPGSLAPRWPGRSTVPDASPRSVVAAPGTAPPAARSASRRSAVRPGRGARLGGGQPRSLVTVNDAVGTLRSPLARPVRPPSSPISSAAAAPTRRSIPAAAQGRITCPASSSTTMPCC